MKTIAIILILSDIGLCADVRTMTVTAYCPCRLCCGPRACGITASGLPVSYNGGKFVAADRSIPFGTMISIPGYGTVPVIDRGGAIRGNHIDVFFPTHKAALQFGVRRLSVQIGSAPPTDTGGESGRR